MPLRLSEQALQRTVRRSQLSEHQASYSHTHFFYLYRPKGQSSHLLCSSTKRMATLWVLHKALGLSLKWFRDNFCNAEKETAKCMGVDEYYLMDKEAEKVPVGANRLLSAISHGRKNTAS